MIKYWTLCFLLFVLTSSAQVKVENDSIIIWNKDRKITWDDFLSEDRVVHKYGHAEAGIALSVIIYPKEIDCWDIDYIQIVAQMNKTKSWVEVKSTQGINHEQLHFDIAELYARKIRKAITGFIDKNEECDLQGIADIYYRLEEEHWQTQFLYDDEIRNCKNRETNYPCVNYEKQWEWDKKIACQLEEYIDYELNVDIDDLDLE